MFYSHSYTGYCSHPRYFSGLLSAALSGFITYVFLEPLFVPVGLNLAMVVLRVLSINATLVGMSLGILLPRIFPGVCLGTTTALLIGTFANVQNTLFFPVIGGVGGLVGVIFSTR
jgi:callose synthase